MTTTMYSSKKGQFMSQYRFAMRKIMGLSAIYALLIFFSYPMVYWQFNNNLSHYHTEAITHYQYAGPRMVSAFTVSALLCFMVLIVSAVLYSYLHGKQSTDFYHSLPVPRKVMFLANMAAGYTALIVPIWVNTLIAMISFPIHLPMVPAREYLRFMMMQVIAWTIGAFVLLSISSLVAVSVSTVIENVGYSAALFLEGSILYGIWILSCMRSFLTYTAVPIESGFNLLYWLSPVFALWYIEVLSCINPQDIIPKLGWIEMWGPLLFWLLLGALAFWGAMKVYEKRQSEHAQQWGRQGVLGFAVKFMAHAMGSFIFTLIFADVMKFPNSVSWIAGTLIGGSLGYLVTEIITNHGFQNMKKALPSMAAATVVMLGFSSYFALHGFGYDKRIAKAENVQSVELELSLPYELSYEWYDDTYAEIYGIKEGTIRPVKPNYILEEKENIDRVIALHSMVLDTYDKYFFGNIDLTYHKNMGTMRRSIRMAHKGSDTLLEILYSDEFLKKYNPFFALKQDYLKEIVLLDKQGNKVKNLSKTVSEQLLEAIQKDLKERTPQQVRDTRNNIELGSILFETKYPKEIYESTGDRYHYNTTLQLLILPSDKNTCALLEKLGIDFTAPMQKPVDMMFVRKKDSYDDVPQYVFEQRSRGTWIDEYGSFVEIEDKEVIEQILEKVSSRNSGYGDQYEIVIKYKNEFRDTDYISYSIDRTVLTELLKDTEIKVPYLLSREEEMQLQKVEREEESNEEMTEAAYRWQENMDMEDSISMKEYVEKYAPQILEGKTAAELKAMENTIYLTSDGIKVIF